MADLLSVSLNCPDPTLHPGAQGIERVAVDDATQRLIVTFFRPVTGGPAYLFDPRSYTLTGGHRRFPRVLRADPYSLLSSPPDPEDRKVVLALDGLGDFSIYTLTVSGPDVDPFFASQKLRFRLACDDPFDCRPPEAEVVPPSEIPVHIDYLAKDYASFRQALLDFVPARMPGWTERSEADLSMMLLELFAATADTLSYVQDRVANEAFLSTATQRRSVAGHLALIGYELDEGAAAWTWLQFQVNAVHTLDVNPGLAVANLPAQGQQPPVIFETLTAATLRPAHNAMALYTWGNQGCCLPQASLQATLAGSYPDLQAGDWLLIDDQRGHCDAVRLVARPEITAPPFPGSPLTGDVTVVRWGTATALRYDYCAADVVVRGNLVPATQGESVLDEKLRDLTPEARAAVEAEVAARQPWQRVQRQRLPLARWPLAHLDRAALVFLAGDGTSRPQLPQMVGLWGAVGQGLSSSSLSTLSVEVEGFAGVWEERTTLLYSRPDEQVFRVEIDNRGEATAVFGDGTFGLRPPDTATVTASYRVGGGAGGNLGPGTLTVPRPPQGESLPWLISVTNPLPASGGRDPESADHARRFGPQTFARPLVAVTAADYQAAAQEYVDAAGNRPVERANATFRWTGSWLTVTEAIDSRQGAAPAGVGRGLDPDLRRGLLAYLDGRRLAGYDLELLPPLLVPIDLIVEFCLRPGFLAADVQQRLKRALGSGILPDGRPAFFHPDNFSFGDSLYVSALYAAMMAVAGVESAEIVRLARLHAVRPDQETADNLRQGRLAVAVDQIIQLEDDRNFPERGVLTVRPKGGAG